MFEKATIESTSLNVPNVIQSSEIIAKTSKKGNENVSRHEDLLEKSCNYLGNCPIQISKSPFFGLFVIFQFFK